MVITFIRGSGDVAGVEGVDIVRMVMAATAGVLYTDIYNFALAANAGVCWLADWPTFSTS